MTSIDACEVPTSSRSAERKGDEELVRRLNAGDTQARSEFFKRFHMEQLVRRG